MTNNLPTTENKWRGQLTAMGPEFEMALPDSVNIERFLRAAKTAVMEDKQLLDCNRESLLKSLMRSAECGLMPNGRDAALVRYKSQVQFIPMIGGLLRLMRNSGEVKEIIVDTVNEGDEFSYRQGDDAGLDHKPAWGDRGTMTGAYAILKTKDGGIYRAVLPLDEINKIRNSSASYRFAESGPQNKGGGKKNSVWHQWPEEMAKKTALRRLTKICPLSIDRLDDVLSADNADYVLPAVNAGPTQLEQMSSRLRGEDSGRAQTQKPADDEVTDVVVDEDPQNELTLDAGDDQTPEPNSLADELLADFERRAKEADSFATLESASGDFSDALGILDVSEDELNKIKDRGLAIQNTARTRIKKKVDTAAAQ